MFIKLKKYNCSDFVYINPTEISTIEVVFGNANYGSYYIPDYDNPLFSSVKIKGVEDSYRTEETPEQIIELITNINYPVTT